MKKYERMEIPRITMACEKGKPLQMTVDFEQRKRTIWEKIKLLWYRKYFKKMMIKGILRGDS